MIDEGRIFLHNRLAYETSPYLLQHKNNPVDWYPWCDEAFEKAKIEDKPVFLSIGYSTCHWCHVMAHESFEDDNIADLLNRHFISIKVDKEERPDIDNVYMTFCQAFTGSGGWPTSVFLTADRKPFFAGTYFPKDSQGGMIGFGDLLTAINEKWKKDRTSLLLQTNRLIQDLNKPTSDTATANLQFAHEAVTAFERMYDKEYGGFGRAPKFPTPHNLLFLLRFYQRYQRDSCLQMAEHTLLQMYKGGLFDHIGFGFSRYSTDKRFLVPHFEKMLYDNAMLMLAYCGAYETTKKTIYLRIAEKTAAFVLRDMTSSDGGFFSALDADSEGEEGKYYLFTPDETVQVLGQKDGKTFNRHFDISEKGNFEHKNIPNLLHSDAEDDSFEPMLEKLNAYRKKRYKLHLDDKILTFWNSLMIAAMCELYRVSKNEKYLAAAKNADAFIRKNLIEGKTLFVSFREDKRGVAGFLEDYAGYAFAQLHLYKSTLDSRYLQTASRICDKVIADFSAEDGGFYLYGNHSEALLLRPKETYDGAVPSGNALMAYNFVRLSLLLSDNAYSDAAKRQLDFIAADAQRYPASHSMYLTALLEYNKPPVKVTVVLGESNDFHALPLSLPSDAAVLLLQNPTEEYPLKNGKTTYYVCRDRNCLPPTNDLA